MSSITVAAGAEVARLSTPELIDHIVTRHHNTLRRELPAFQRRIARVMAQVPSYDSHLTEVSRLWSELSRETLEHQGLEEREIFPAIEAAPACVSSLGPVAVIARAAWVDKLVHDHSGIQKLWERLRKLTNDYEPAHDAPLPLRRLYLAMYEIDRDVREHLRKENELLFPRLVNCLS